MFLSPTYVYVGYFKSYSDDLYYGKKAYEIPSDVASIQSEIMRNGPITVEFRVYKDLYHFYRNGEDIYSYRACPCASISNFRLFTMYYHGINGNEMERYMTISTMTPFLLSSTL